MQEEFIKTQKEKQEGTEKKYKINGKTRYKMEICTYILIITLNVNELNALIKRHSMGYLIKKTYNMLPKRDPL